MCVNMEESEGLLLEERGICGKLEFQSSSR